MNRLTLKTSLLLPLMAMAATCAPVAHAAAPGIVGPNFNLVAHDAYLNQPDGNSLYSWGYGCQGSPKFAPAAITGASCSNMQVPGPTLIVTEGDLVSVTLTNNLPTMAGNTSILFPGFNVTTTVGNSSNCTDLSCGVTGLLTGEAVPGGSVTYTFTATTPGTRAYYSGTQGDLQVEMGMYGAVIVLPASVPANCSKGLPVTNPGGNKAAQAHWQETDFRLSQAAFDHPKSCYDREYLFQFSEMDLNIHQQAQAQVNDPIRVAACGQGASAPGCSMQVPTEPYHPAYFLINGRSMPDDMDANYEVEYPHQPYNGNPHMHPGELVLLRIIGQGRWQHPFHEHANHVRILARDGNLLLSQSNNNDLAGPALFTTTTTPGMAMDGIFYYTGRGLNWDMYGHHPGSSDALGSLPCTPDANGYNTGATTALNYFEWCQDHNKPLEATPVGDVGSGGPVTLPNPLIFTNGVWYGGSPYLGQDATDRSSGPTTNLLPADTPGNPAGEKGFAFMWHSHNEREITTDNVFPGGMMMMMLVDPRDFVIDESK